MDILSPCPFCGGVADMKIFISSDDLSVAHFRVKVFCRDCFVAKEGIGLIKLPPTPETCIDAIKAAKKNAAYFWNARAI